MGRRLVLVGAGHAHLTTISAIRSIVKRGHEVTVVAPSDHHYYSGMAPGMLAGTYSPRQIRFNVHKLAADRGGNFVTGTVTSIDPVQKQVVLGDGTSISYDVASFNIGSQVPTGKLEPLTDNVYPVKPIQNLLEGRQAVLDLWQRVKPGRKLNLSVAGGGPAGVEIAGALWRLCRNNGIMSEITIITGKQLLDTFPERFVKRVRRSLSRRSIIIKEGAHVSSVDASGVTLDTGPFIPADLVFLATGVVPPLLFKDSGLPTGRDGGLLVNSCLQSVGYPEVFGGGDCVTFEGEKLPRVGVYAVRENPVLLSNLAAALEGNPLQRFNPGDPDFLLILNMGDGKGVFRKGEWIFQGRPAFWIKDFIDRRFMRKFQLSGELEEEL